MEQEPVVGFVSQVLWDVASEGFLNFEWCLAVSQSQAVRNPEHMCVNCDCSLAKDNAHYHIGRLATHTRQLCEFVHGTVLLNLSTSIVAIDLRWAALLLG